jgi:hypothetical protein
MDRKTLQEVLDQMLFLEDELDLEEDILAELETWLREEIAK